MKNRRELQKQLIENRLMTTKAEFLFFEEAMEIIYQEENLENISIYVKAFDDATEEPEVMFGMIHGIENYNNIFNPTETLQKLINSVKYFNDNSKDWQEIIFLRIINDKSSRELLKRLLLDSESEDISIINEILNRIIKRNKDKFESNVNYVLEAIK